MKILGNARQMQMIRTEMHVFGGSELAQVLQQFIVFSVKRKKKKKGQQVSVRGGNEVLNFEKKMIMQEPHM